MRLAEFYVSLQQGVVWEPIGDDDGVMLVRWRYSLWLLLTYVIVFLLWGYFPSRASFLITGGVAVSFLVAGMLRARRAGYFVNRVDLSIHALVIADLAIETVAFEAFRLAQPNAMVEQFHDNANFIGCAIVFVVLVGGHRWYALSAREDLG